MSAFSIESSSDRCPKSKVRVGMLVGSVSMSSNGVSEAVHSLALALRRIPDVSVDIFTLGEPGAESRNFGDISVHFAKKYEAGSFGYAPDLGRLLTQHPVDLLHVHGLWMYQSIAALNWAARTGRPYVVSPHGMLDPWALNNSRWKKRIARVLFENGHLNGAKFVHALCEAERIAIERAGIVAPTVILPNGVHRPRRICGRAPWRESLGDEVKVVLFLGRVTPKKRVVELVRAWRRARGPLCPWHLVIVGPTEPSYAAELSACLNEAGSDGSVHLVGPAYGDARGLAYASANAFILPSVSEGLPMAALEAFAAGLPALLTRQCNLPQSFDFGCALEISASEQGIEQGLRRLFQLTTTERLVMGEKAAQLVTDHFNWDLISRRFSNLYSTLIHTTPAAN